MSLLKKTLLVSTLSTLLFGCISDQNNSIDNITAKSNELKNKLLPLNPEVWKKIESEVVIDVNSEIRIKTLLKSMTLAQKVAQMIQPEIRDITPEDMRKYGFGSYLNGGGAFPNNNKHSTPSDWIDLAETMYQASIDDSLDGSSIPTMWGTDAVHGHNNVIGATLFPHNIGLGAANNPELMEKIAKITATEVMVTGIDWVFAPTVATVRDDRWGRTYEGYSEDPEIVKLYAGAVVKGLQGHADDDFLGNDRVISTVKHFIGDGGTLNGDDQGDNQLIEADLYKLHAQGYVSGLKAGAQSVMASFNSWNGEKVHGSHYLLTEVLKERMGFDGFVVGDWNGHGQVKGCSNESCPQAINAGLDIFMVPTAAWKPLLENTIKQVNDGIIPISRIDDAVTRILRVKLRAGLFDKPSPAKRMYSGRTKFIGSDEHRVIARQAVQESLVLLKNKASLLPLSPKLNILMAGDGADNIGKQSGGWTITWQGTGNSNKDFPGGTSIYQGITDQVTKAGGSVTLSEDGSYNTKPDVAIVVFGEEPYAEGQGDIDSLDFQYSNKKPLALLKKFKQQGIPVVSLFISGRPMWVNAELNASDAFVATWLPGSEGAGIADVILTDVNNNIQNDFIGRLSFSWPNRANQTAINRYDTNDSPLFNYGFGLSYKDKDTLADNLDETTGNIVNSNDKMSKIDIFNGAVKQPLSLWLFSGEQEVSVTANAHELARLNYRTVDKIVQEDAFKLSIKKSSTESSLSENATLTSGVRIKLANMADVENNIQLKGHLLFDVKLLNRPEGDVLLSMACSSSTACQHKLAITDVIQSLNLHDWQTISVNLSCFDQQGINLEKVTMPFELSSAGDLDIALSNIIVDTDNNEAAMVNCE